MEVIKNKKTKRVLTQIEVEKSKLAGPYTVFFVSPMRGDNFVIKGSYQAGLSFLNEMDLPAIYHYVIYYNRNRRDFRASVNDAARCFGIHVICGNARALMWIPNSRIKSRFRYQFYAGNRFLFDTRKFPRSFPKQLTKFIEKVKRIVFHAR